jgi:hypothetical protein
MEEARAGVDPYEQGEKQRQLAAKLKRHRSVEFHDYIDRDVPHIAADGQFAKKRNTKGLKEFKTGPAPTAALFEDLLKEAEAEAGLPGWGAGAPATGAGKKGRDGGGDHLPSYL